MMQVGTSLFNEHGTNFNECTLHTLVKAFGVAVRNRIQNHADFIFKNPKNKTK